MSVKERKAHLYSLTQKGSRWLSQTTSFASMAFLLVCFNIQPGVPLPLSWVEVYLSVLLGTPYARRNPETQQGILNAMEYFDALILFALDEGYLARKQDAGAL